MVELVEETAQTRSIALSLAGWSGHRAGQHVDVRLTAEDGYQAQRSYSIASAPEDADLVLTGRINSDLLGDVAWSPSERPLAYVCGPTGFVENAASTLVALGHEPVRIRTERFGPTGG